MNIAIIGGTGFIGNYLNNYLKEKGNNVFIISRYIMQDNEELRNIIKKSDILINLAGESINGRWTKKKKRRIIESRVNITEKIFAILKTIEKTPQIYIQASAIGIYNEEENNVINEKCKNFSDAFLGYVTKAWEKIPKNNNDLQLRIVILRFGIVLGINGGFLKKLMPLLKKKIGIFFSKNKNRSLAFIYLKEIGPIIEHIIENKNIKGEINIVNNIRITYEEFFKYLIKKFNIKLNLWIPDLIIKLTLGEASSLLFSSYIIVPEILNNSGYDFRYKNIEEIIDDIKKEV